MNVDNYSELQEFVFPKKFWQQEDLGAAEEFTGKQLWYSMHYFHQLSVE